MPKKTLVKIFAVLAVAAIAFASITTFGGDDTVSGSAAGLPAVTRVKPQQSHHQQVQHLQHYRHKTSSLVLAQKCCQLQLLPFITH